MKPDPIVPHVAEVRQDAESEQALIQAAREVLSTSRWKIGELAAQWTESWAKGRTDEDFGAMIGLSGDQVQQRRRVWERFGVSDTYRNLSWSHYYAALNWDDATECLQWASENQATVREMKEWRAAQYGVPASETVQDDDDPFFSGGSSTDDPFAVPDSGDQELPPPPSTESGEHGGNGAGGSENPEKTPDELFRIQKAKTVKTLDAVARALADLNSLRKKPRKCEALLARIYPVIDEVKEW